MASARTDRVVERLARLLTYPDDSFPAAVAACQAVLARDAAAAAADLDRFAQRVAALTIAQLRELYVATFDLNPRCTLDVGWHLFGDTYDRGALLASLRAELARLEIDEHGELPDHLPTLLRLIDASEPARAAELTALVAPAIERLQATLVACDNPYAWLVKSVVRAATAGG
jgi:nitrate reductase molybdenum cofactor assembly chaperone NarJ/NarW